MAKEYAYYFAAGLIITLITWPFARGRRSGEGFNTGRDVLYLVAMTTVWPFFLVAIMWLSLIWYRNYWLDYLNFRTEKHRSKIQLEFDDRWSGASNEGKFKYEFENQLKEINIEVKKLNENIENRRYTLEGQIRKGLWWNR